jgi:hypothetical protein
MGRNHLEEVGVRGIRHYTRPFQESMWEYEYLAEYSVRIFNTLTNFRFLYKEDIFYSMKENRLFQSHSSLWS